MPSTATNGLVTPLDTDPVADGAKAIRDLAAGIQSGSFVADIITQGTVVAVPITFPVAYPSGSTPNVILTVGTTAPQSRMVGVTGITNTGFTAQVVNTGSTADVAVQWIAV